MSTDQSAQDPSLNVETAGDLDSTSDAELMNQILAANALEQSGDLDQAISIYQHILEMDPEGTFGSMAQEALKSLESVPEAPVDPPAVILQPLSDPTEVFQSPSYEPEPTSSESHPILRAFYNLSIGRKQLALLGLIEITVFLLIGVGSYLLYQSLRVQLLNQARSELAISQRTYNNRLNQLGTITRNQAENAILISSMRSLAEAETPSVLRIDALQDSFANLIQDYQVEYVTLVDPDRAIVLNANADRQDELFDPEGLTTQVLASQTQVRTITLLSQAELERESIASITLEDMAPNEAILASFVAHPVTDPNTNESLGVLIVGDLINTDESLASDILRTFGTQVESSTLQQDGGYSGIYANLNGEFTLAVSQFQAQTGVPKSNVPLPDTADTNQLLSQAVVNNPKRLPHIGWLQIGDRSYAVAVAALQNQWIETSNGTFTGVPIGDPVAIMVRGTPQTALTTLLNQNISLLVGVGVSIIVIHIILALLLGRSITNPMQQLGQVARAFSQGDRRVRAAIEQGDEVGQLARTFNAMAESIVNTESELAFQVDLRQSEAERQRQLREELQQGVINLLLEIEGAQKGDLTIQAHVTEGEVGSIADAFNTTLRSLRQLVLQVKVVANRVNQLAYQSETTAEKLSPNAQTQATALSEAVIVVESNTAAVQRVAESANEAAEIAEYGAQLARVGDDAMGKTVLSMDKIRTTAADAAKQVKRLAESSQEISQIVGIISGIADRTNLLAFNASLEAARAGEHGQGFRQIADEVRRLALQVNDFAGEIEQLITGIQQETTDVIKGMEVNTTEVVTGTQLVNQTQVTLRELLDINQQIDEYLDSISKDAQVQTEMSQQVNETMISVTQISENTSSESQSIVTSLRELVHEVEALQSTVSRFQVDVDDESINSNTSSDQPMTLSDEAPTAILEDARVVEMATDRH